MQGSHSTVLAQQIDRNGRTREFTYDALNRLVREDWVAAGVTANTLQFTYDAVGNVLAAGDANSFYSMSYDARGRVTSVGSAAAPGLPSFVLSYT